MISQALENISFYSVFQIGKQTNFCRNLLAVEIVTQWILDVMFWQEL